MNIYVVEMVRRDDSVSGTPHYIVGVYDDETAADYAGATEVERRGYKYNCRIVNCVLNESTK